MEVGVDIVEIERIKKIMGNNKLLNRIFSNEELEYCFKKKKCVQSLAVRFAAKEAIWKVINKKINCPRKLIKIENDPEGKPKATLPNEFARINKKISISLSHTDKFAIAVAILND